MITHEHHEYLFDNRHRDLETGKMNIDKLTTLNSGTLANLMDREYKENSCINYAQGHYSSEDNSFRGLEELYNAYKFPEREKELLRKQNAEKKRKDKELERQVRLHEERKQYEERQREEFEEYRLRIQIREEQLIKERYCNLPEKVSYSGQRIITSKWNVR